MEHDKLEKNIDKLARHFEKANFTEYVELLQKPWKFFWLQFCAGLLRGVGTAIGFTIIFAIVIYILIAVLRNFMGVPIIGSYIAQLVEFVNQSLRNGISR
ncbi:MAG: DUF5665 domain-containing protein [Candidatus Saganbacteria bacterium]|nr:DUF5665 domain-containing protein [Candidatus Saganbacteria bacterium]